MEEEGGSCPACRTPYKDEKVTTGESVRPEDLGKEEKGNANTFALLDEDGAADFDDNAPEEAA